MYINLIGIDGSGKDSVYQEIIKAHPEAVQIYEPGGTAKADVIRKVLLSDSKNVDRIKTLKRLMSSKLTPFCRLNVERAIKEISQYGMTGLAEAFLYAASRAETNSQIVKPALAKRCLVIGRRSVACSMSYQGWARGVGMEKVWTINQPALSIAKPNFEIFLDVSAEEAQRRTQLRGKADRFDRASLSFRRKTVEGYKRYYKDFCPYPSFFVDASLTKGEVVNQVSDILNRILKRGG